MAGAGTLTTFASLFFSTTDIAQTPSVYGKISPFSLCCVPPWFLKHRTSEIHKLIRGCVLHCVLYGGICSSIKTVYMDVSLLKVLV